MTIRELLVGLGFKINEESERQAEQGISDLKDKATQLLGAIGIGFSLVGLNAISEEFSTVNTMINQATSALGDQEEIQHKILEAANATRSSYADTAKTVSSLVQENSELFGTVDEAIAFNNAATQLFKTAGKTNDQIAGLMESINKSFAKGKVDSETISQLLEQSPEAVALLNKRLGSTTDQLEQLASDGKISLEDLKATFVDSADEIGAAFSATGYSISDALLNIRNQWGQWVASMDETLGISNAIGTTMVRGFNMVMDVLRKVQTRIEWLSDKLGGTDKLLRLVAITAGAIFAAFNFTKITSGLQSILKLAGGINLKAVAIVAVIVLLALLVEDFINFLQGNDSMIGSLFDKAGIGAENARQAIFKAWETVTSFLKKTWEVIKGLALSIFGALQDWWEEHGEAVLKAFRMIWDSIKTMLAAAWTLIKNLAISIFGGLTRFWQQHGEQIKSALSAVWNAIKTILTTVWNVIKTVATTIFGGLLKFWEKHGDQLKTSFTNIWNGIQQIISRVWNAIKAIVQAACTIVGAIIKTVFGAIKSFWDTWGSTIIAYFSGVWETIKAVFGAAMDILADLFAIFSDLFSGNWSQLWEDVKTLISDVWNGIVNIVTTILESMWNVISSVFNTIWEGITTTVGNIKDSIVDGFQAAINWITGLPAQALQWGADIITGIVDGIKGAVGKVTDAVKDVADKIKSFLHFSVPDEGPLTDYQSWMPDFMGGLAAGIEQSAPKVLSAAEALAGKLANSMNIEVPDNSTAVEALTNKLGNAVKDFAPKAALTLQSLTGDIGHIAQSAVASPKTAQTSVGGSTSKVITQNVNISNQFNGDRAGQQKSSEAMDKATNDSTEELARALKYAR
ncbi:tape measure protein [Oscillospiraceae bacterium 50-16]